MKATKNIHCMKGKGTIDYSTVTKWFKKFCLGCKNLDDQAKSGKPKTVNFKAMLKAIKAKLASNTQKVSGELSIS